MTAPVELGYGEGAEGDPGPSVIELSPVTSTDRTAARILKIRGSGFRVFAAFAGRAEELVWTASGFVGLYAAGSSVAGPDLSGVITFTIRRSPFWPSGACGLRVEATGEGESVGIGGGTGIIG